MSRRHLDDQRCEGRPRDPLEAARSESYFDASRAADGDPLSQLRHQIQVPVSVHSLQEYVRFKDGCIKTFHLFTGANFLFPFCCSLNHNSLQDWTPFEVPGHSEVCVRPLHWTAGFADVLKATCTHAFCKLCQRELQDCATRASRAKPRGSDA